MFSKRHYEKIALVMQDLHDKGSAVHGSTKWQDTVAELADMFARDNGQFKRDRFERACVPGANVRARTA
jgi:hypothetical protein